MSKWGNFNFDISAVGKVIKNVEKSIDKAIGIPDQPDTEGNNNNDNNTSFSSSPGGGSSFFGYSFTTPTKSTPTITTPNKQQQSSQQSNIININNTTTTTTTTATPTTPITNNNNNNNGSILNITPIKPRQDSNTIVTQPQSIPTPKYSENESKEINLNRDNSDNEDEKPLFKVDSLEDEKQQPPTKDDSIEKESTGLSESLQMNKDEHNNGNNDSWLDDQDDIEIPDTTETIEIIENTNENEIQQLNNIQAPQQPELQQPEQSEQLQQQPESQQTQPQQLSSTEFENIKKENQQLKNQLMEIENKFKIVTMINDEQKRIVSDKEKVIEDITGKMSKLSILNDQLLTDISKLNVDSKKEDLENLKEEFSRRLGQVEKKLSTITKERDQLKAGTQLPDSIAESIKGKDEKITLLTNEGTSLSHRILTLESSNKKFKQTIKENEETITMLNDRVNASESLLLSKSERVKEFEEADKRYQDTINTMKEVTDSASKKLDRRDQEADKAIKQASDLQQALEKAWKDISDLNKHHAVEVDRYLKQIDQEKHRVKNEFQLVSNQEKKEYAEKIEQLETIISEHRSTISRNNEKQTWKEDELAKEINHLQQRCRDAEIRNDQLSSSIPQATRPLLKQIESITEQFNERQSNWEQLEKSLNTQLRDERVRAEQVVINQQEILSELEELTHKFQLLEGESKIDKKKLKSYLTEIQQSKSLQEDQLLKFQEFEQTITSLNQKLSDHQSTIHQLKDQIDKQQKQFTDEKDLLEKEYLNKLKKQQKQLLQQQQQQTIQESSTSSPSQSLNSSSNSINNTNNNNNNPLSNSIGYNNSNSNNNTPSKTMMGLFNGLKKTPSNHDFLNNGGGIGGGISSSTSLEYIQALLSQKEGETQSLQAQVQSLDYSRKKLEDELVKLTTDNEQLLSECREFKLQGQEIKDIQQRYQTSLVLLGEKEESVNELRLDIIDLKDLYKNQINELLLQIESLKKK